MDQNYGDRPKSGLSPKDLKRAEIVSKSPIFKHDGGSVFVDIKDFTGLIERPFELCIRDSTRPDAEENNGLTLLRFDDRQKALAVGARAAKMDTEGKTYDQILRSLEN